MKKLLITLCTALALLCPALLWAQIPVSINSGDPAFPFPQFLPYVHPSGDTLHNLGTRNPDGVVHAEMEKTVRDAYRIMMNRADYYQDISLGGTRYVKFRSSPDCSEGTGYAMLAAAMMADKRTFDGLWLFTHDYAMNRVTHYRDGSSAPSYDYSVLPGWTNTAGENSAADGDFDIALSLMIANMQWGDDMGISDSRGNPISYRDDFIKVARGLSDTVIHRASGNILSGDIGLDGYFKGGDSWAELTGWSAAAANLASIGMSGQVELPGPVMQHIDYTAPAYFRQFADYLSGLDSSRYAWNISQFRRAEASSDWLIGKLIAQNQRNIPVAGWVSMPGGAEPAFTNFNDAGDFRAGWRTVLNYVWHGNPAYSWDPSAHQIIRNAPNTHQKDAGLRFARFLWDRRQTPWNSAGETVIGAGGASWWGPSVLKYSYSVTGEELTTFPLNWMHGTGSPSAVAAQDRGLMAEMYRQCELEWDTETAGDKYLTGVPAYFHGFFRLLGMMTLTGNNHAPLNMKRQANMKVYLDIDKTYALEGDTVTYTADYRNYGAEDAIGAAVTVRLHDDMVYLSSTGGGAYDAAANAVRWDASVVPGYRSSMGAHPVQTMGSVSFRVIIPNAGLKRYEIAAEITCANGTGWASNEFPNRVSSVMKRNGVDIARRALRVAHSVDMEAVNPEMAAVYAINFENGAETGRLSGGRPGVNFSYAHSGTAASGASHTFMVRIFNDAHEAYIDYGNYRISYFMFDNDYSGLTAWSASADIISPSSMSEGLTVSHEPVMPGQDAKGGWNQRLIIHLSGTRADTNWASMAAPTQFLQTYYGAANRIHRGVSEPFKAVWRMYAGNYANRNWGADWSFNPAAAGNVAGNNIADWGFPVTPDFTESYEPGGGGKPVTSPHRKLIGAAPSAAVDNILIEEWDGCVWRRVAGNGPVPVRELTNFVIRDTLPDGVEFLNFIEPYPFGIEPSISGRVVTWGIDKMAAGASGSIRYAVSAGGLPAGIENRVVTSRVWASADGESPVSSEAALTVTSGTVSVLAHGDRVTPGGADDAGTAAVVPPNVLTGEFAAGPNPVSRSSGVVNFYRRGNRINDAVLTVYDAMGNVVNKISISDNPALSSSSKPSPDNGNSRRAAGAWDLRDAKGRQVPPGTYLVRGVITVSGKREKVSLAVSVR